MAPPAPSASSPAPVRLFLAWRTGAAAPRFGRGHAHPAASSSGGVEALRSRGWRRERRLARRSAEGGERSGGGGSHASRSSSLPSAPRPAPPFFYASSTAEGGGERARRLPWGGCGGPARAEGASPATSERGCAAEGRGGCGWVSRPCGEAEVEGGRRSCEEERRREARPRGEEEPRPEDLTEVDADSHVGPTSNRLVAGELRWDFHALLDVIRTRRRQSDQAQDKFPPPPTHLKTPLQLAQSHTNRKMCFIFAIAH